MDWERKENKMIEINELTKRYEDGVLALDHVSYSVEPGEIFCLLGGYCAAGFILILVLRGSTCVVSKI